jgi:hypothetical protein
MFQKVDLFLSSGEWVRCTFSSGGLEKLISITGLVIEVIFFYWIQQSSCLPASHLRMETNPVFETLCSLEYRTMNKVQGEILGMTKAGCMLHILSLTVFIVRPNESLQLYQVITLI